jgi:hypothetical protein
LECIPLFTRGLAGLPDHPKLLRELRLLERHTHRSGKDAVDHPRNGHDDHANAVCGVLPTHPTLGYNLVVFESAQRGKPSKAENRGCTALIALLIRHQLYGECRERTGEAYATSASIDYRCVKSAETWAFIEPHGLMRRRKSAPPKSRVRGYAEAMPNEDDISHEETTDPLVANARNFYKMEKDAATAALYTAFKDISDLKLSVMRARQVTVWLPSHPPLSKPSVNRPQMGASSSRARLRSLRSAHSRARSGLCDEAKPGQILISARRIFCVSRHRACSDLRAKKSKHRYLGRVNAYVLELEQIKGDEIESSLVRPRLRATACREHLQQNIRSKGRSPTGALVSESAAPHRAATSLNRLKVSMCSSRLVMRYIG